MRRSYMLAPLTALVLLLAACGGDEGGTTDTGSDAEGTGSSADAVLAVAESELGEILVDGDGMTLYLFTEDPPGESVCTDDCLAAWPPLLVDGEPSVGEGVDEALVGTLVRDDGSTQVTYDQAPLYRWASDSEPGDVTGQDVQGVWYVVSPDGEAIQETEGTDDTETGSGPSY